VKIKRKLRRKQLKRILKLKRRRRNIKEGTTKK
jgi:hypothetical protein